MKEIVLRHSGVVVMVSDGDYDFLMQWRWKVKRSPRSCYVWRRPPTGKVIFMHRLIMNAPDDMQVDHIDGNGLNNVRENLRICTKDQNAKNRRNQENSASKYTGVSPCKPRSRVTGEYHGYVYYLVTITVDGKRMTVGTYKNEIDAAKAFDRAALYYRGEFAHLNFPDLKEEYLKSDLSAYRKIRNLSSAYKGVTKHKQGGKWMAWIVVGGKTIYLGYHKDEESAAVAWDLAALKYYGNDRALNFPDKINDYLCLINHSERKEGVLNT